MQQYESEEKARIVAERLLRQPKYRFRVGADAIVECCVIELEGLLKQAEQCQSSGLPPGVREGLEKDVTYVGVLLDSFNRRHYSPPDKYLAVFKAARHLLERQTEPVHIMPGHTIRNQVMLPDNSTPHRM